MSATPRNFRHGELPRLPREYYQGDAVVHWTLSTFDRATGWLSDHLHTAFRELMLHTAERETLYCPTYCLMPDHVHLLWMGLRRDSDQINGMAFLRTHLEPLLSPAKFQPQAHDNVLRQPEREHDAFARVCSYVLSNPVAAKLVERPDEWRFRGAVIPGYPKLDPLESDFWRKFWALYERKLDPEAASIIRPPF